MSRKSIGDALGVLGVIASLGFVGMELRQSNIEARAAAFQGIGAQLNEFHQFVGADSTLNRLFWEASQPELVAQWSVADWRLVTRGRVSSLRIAESVQLQAEQGLLDETAMERLGGFGANTEVYGFACLWPMLSTVISPGLRDYVNRTHPLRLECVPSAALDSFLAGAAA